MEVSLRPRQNPRRKANLADIPPSRANSRLGKSMSPSRRIKAGIVLRHGLLASWSRFRQCLTGFDEGHYRLHTIKFQSRADVCQLPYAPST